MNPVTISLIPFAAPAVWGMMIIKKDKISFKLVFFSFLCSFFSVITAIVLQLFAGFLQDRFLERASLQSLILFKSFFYTGLIEEAAKCFFFLVFIKIVRNKDADNSTVNAAVPPAAVAVFYGLVFASFENLAYELLYAGSSVLTRLLTADILHAGLGIYYAKIYSAIQRKTAILLFCVPCFLHGLYNMFLNIGGFFSAFAFIISIYAALNIVKAYTAQKETETIGR